MEGSILYPLNQLRGKYPAVYARALRRYTGRESLLEERIPLLDCLWNDVIHFSPVHPQKVASAYRRAGGSWIRKTWLEIDLASAGFDSSNTVIFLHQPKQFGEMGLHAEDFLLFQVESMATMCELPHETVEHYEESFRQNRRPFLFLWVPHVLHKGTVDIANFRQIEI